MQRANGTRWTRRRFLKRAAAAGGLVAAPHVITSNALGANGRPPASERVVLGYLGVGPRGQLNLREQMGCPEAQMVAVCDVWKHLRESVRDYVNQQYGNKDCKTYVDLRELLARDDIDAVGIGTPDHWHVPAAIAAMKAGKDVHVEKPLGISIEEDLACRDVARRHGRIFQYSAESRSCAHCRHGAELVRNGRIGKIREIRVKAPDSGPGGSTAPRPVPAGLDYDLWLGPAPWRPYSGCPNGGGSWYHVRDYALGFIAGWAAHPLDLMVWACDVDQAGPWEVEGTGAIPTAGCNDVVTRWDVRIRFADGTPMLFQAWGVSPETEPRLAQAGNYVQFIGTDGWIAMPYAGLVVHDDALLRERIEPDGVHLTRSRGHESHFIECVRTRRTPVDSVDDAIRSDLISQVSEVAIRTGRKITWDPAAERIVGDSEASRLVSRPVREPWGL